MDIEDEGGAEAGAAAAEEEEEEVAAEVEEPLEPLDEIVEEDAPGDIKIKRNYQRAGTKRGPTLSVQLCPKCGQEIPINEFAEHMRIELLDPKWREQTDRAWANRAGDPYAANDAVAANLSAFAGRRGDIFGAGQQAAGAAGPSSGAAGNWDNHLDSAVAMLNRRPEGEHPAAKRLKYDRVPEDAYAISFAGRCHLQIVDQIGGQSFTYDFNIRDTITTVKARLAEATEIRIARQNLATAGGEMLEDDKSLAFYNLKQRQQLFLSLKQ